MESERFAVLEKEVSSHGWKGVGRYSYQEEKQEKEWWFGNVLSLGSLIYWAAGGAVCRTIDYCMTFPASPVLLDTPTVRQYCIFNNFVKLQNIREQSVVNAHYSNKKITPLHGS